MEFWYEKAAMRGEAMPDGLDWLDAQMFGSLRDLYARVQSGAASVERGKQEKAKLVKAYTDARENEAFNQKLVKRMSEMYKAVELAASAYQKDRTLENADKIMDALYRLVEPDFELKWEAGQNGT